MQAARQGLGRALQAAYLKTQSRALDAAKHSEAQNKAIGRNLQTAFGMLVVAAGLQPTLAGASTAGDGEQYTALQLRALFIVALMGLG